MKERLKKRLSFLSLSVLIFSILMMTIVSPVYAGRDRNRGRQDRRYHRPRREKIRKRSTDKDIDRLIAIGGIYFLTKAISEAGRRPRKKVYVSPPPPRYIYVPSPQPTYTPSAFTSVVTVRNATNWYVLVNVNGMELNLYPGCEQAVSWVYTGRGQYIEARAYLDAYRNSLAGVYQGNLVGYQIPWRLNFDYCSFR